MRWSPAHPGMHLARSRLAKSVSYTHLDVYKRQTDSSHDSPIYPNLYRNVIPDRPDMVWVADFTYGAPRPLGEAYDWNAKEKGGCGELPALCCKGA